MVNHDVTVRKGTSEKYWYTLAGYSAVAILGIIYNIVVIAQSGGDAQTVGIMSGFAFLAVSGLGVLIYPALFKDSAYLRGTRQRWKPKWWNYIGVGLGIPAAVAVVVSLFTHAGLAFSAAIMIHALTAPGVSIYYLYNRHNRVGIP